MNYSISTYNIDTLNYLMKDGWKVVNVENMIGNVSRFNLQKSRVSKDVEDTKAKYNVRDYGGIIYDDKGYIVQNENQS